MHLKASVEIRRYAELLRSPAAETSQALLAYSTGWRREKI